MWLLDCSKDNPVMPANMGNASIDRRERKVKLGLIAENQGKVRRLFALMACTEIR